MNKVELNDNTERNESAGCESKTLQILCTFADADNKYDLIRQMSKMLVDKQMVDEKYGEFVIDREEDFPTGIPSEPIAVAIPHSENGSIYQSSIVAAKLIKPITFKRMDKPDEDIEVKMVFLLAVQRNEEQLKMLVKLMRIVQDHELINRIYNSEDCLVLEKHIKAEIEKTEIEE
ncbi:MAG: PTS sugar transporter subunit IIA [Eubacteriaceae bacterium]|nr:PTS sugar transporter subunit IIA [Eubacteriaceae bacterium]